MVILIDQQNLPEDVYAVIFATEQREVVAKMLVKYMAENGAKWERQRWVCSPTTFTKGKLSSRKKANLPCSRKQGCLTTRGNFMIGSLRRCASMGLIEYDLFKKTYKLSDKFNKLMVRIGLMWLRELDRLKK